MIALNETSILPMNFAGENLMRSKNFCHKIFLAKNVTEKIFRINYLELELTRTKIKQFTVAYIHVHKQKMFCIEKTVELKPYDLH